jgi:hypothetical protein
MKPSNFFAVAFDDIAHSAAQLLEQLKSLKQKEEKLQHLQEIPKSISFFFCF